MAFSFRPGTTSSNDGSTGTSATSGAGGGPNAEGGCCIASTTLATPKWLLTREPVPISIRSRECIQKRFL